MTALILLFLGLLFIFLEFYIPGAILGTIGGILLVVSIIYVSTQNTLLVAFIYSLFVIILVILLITFTLRRIPKSKGKYSIYLNKDQEGYKATELDISVIGKTGKVISDLKPAGYVVVEGKKYQAISQTGYIPQGSEVVVIGGEEDNLIVKLSKKDEKQYE